MVIFYRIFILFGACCLFCSVWLTGQTALMLMLRIRTTSVESPVLFLHLAACFAERGGLLSAAYDKRQSSIYGRYLSLVSGYLLSNIIFLERAVIGQNGGRHSSTSDLRTWHIIVGPGYIDTVNRLIDDFISGNA